MFKPKARTAILVSAIVVAAIVAFMVVTVDTRNPADVSKAKIRYVKESLVEYVQQTGTVPKQLSEVPALAAHPTFLRDGWGGDINIR